MLSAYLLLSYIGAPAARWQIRRRLSRGKEDPVRYREKFGETNVKRPDGTLVWMHAVGVGEALALPNLILEMQKQKPDLSFLITTSVRNAAVAIQKNLPKNTTHQYLPLDCKPFITKFLDHWAPNLSIWAERDIWPALINEAHSRGIPLVIVNGKMDAQSAQKKSRAKSLFHATYAKFEFIDVQEQASKAGFQSLGVEIAKISISGSLKSSGPALFVDEVALQSWQSFFGDSLVWLAASTHFPEEALVLEAHDQIRKTHPNAQLIIAPRDPSRLGDLHESGIVIEQGQPPKKRASVYIESEIGNMGLWYTLAQSAFIGGSISDIGGHNPYEAARLNCAITHGSNVQNFTADYDLLKEMDAAQLIKNAGELAKVVLNGASQRQLDAAKSAADMGSQSTQALSERLLSLLPPKSN